MAGLLEAVDAILAKRGVLTERPLELREDQRGNKCEPIAVRAAGDYVALRLGHDDWPRQLAELKKEESVRKLPDFFLFAAPAKRAEKRGVRLKVVICEMKSGEAGAAAAVRQLRLGKLLAKYLVGVAALHLGEPEPREGDEILYGGMIAVPRALYRVGTTDPRRSAQPEDDPIACMPVHKVSGGGEVDIDRICLA